MSVADIIFSIIGLFFIIRGIIRGFVAEFMSLAALVCGIVIGFFFQSNLSPHLKEHISNDTWRPIVAFLIIFVSTYVIVKIIELCLHKIISTIQLNGLDRSLGAVWGFLVGAAVISLIVFLIYSFDFKAGIKILENSIAADFAKIFLNSIGVETFSDISILGKLHV